LRLWRIVRRDHAGLDGEGARLYGARWNSPATAVLYAASHLSLAALEYLVHVDPDDAPDDLVALRLDIPEWATALILASPMSLRADRRRGRRTRTPRLRLPILAHAHHLHTLAIIAHGLRKPAGPPHDSASDAAYPPRTGEEPTGSHSIHDRFPATAGIFGQSMFKTEEKN